MKRNPEIEVDQLEERAFRQSTVSGSAGMNGAAGAALVNRTHRVVRERARSMQERRSKMRSLWIPLAVSGSMLAVIIVAISTILEQDELVPTGLPDANQQVLVLMMWCLPVTVLLLAVILYRRDNATTDNGSAK